MFTVGLDVDKLVSTELHFLVIIFDYIESEREKILLYAGNSSISSPLVSIALGKIYLKSNIKYSRQSAGNFSFSRKVTTNTNPPVKLTGVIELIIVF